MQAQRLPVLVLQGDGECSRFGFYEFRSVPSGNAAVYFWTGWATVFELGGLTFELTGPVRFVVKGP